MKETIAELRKKCQVDVDLPWNMKYWKKYSIYLTKIFLTLKFNANHVTFLWLFIGYVGAFFIGMGGYWNSLIGVLLYQFALFLDYNDGEIARYTNTKNLGGNFLDGFAGSTMTFFILLSIGIGSYIHFDKVYFLWAGIIAASAYMLDQYIKLKRYHILIYGKRYDQIEEAMTSTKENKDKILSINNRFTTFIFEFFRFHIMSAVLFAAIFGVLHWLLLFYTVTMPIIFLRSFKSIYLNLKTLKKKDN